MRQQSLNLIANLNRVQISRMKKRMKKWWSSQTDLQGTAWSTALHWTGNDQCVHFDTVRFSYSMRWGACWSLMFYRVSLLYRVISSSCWSPPTLRPPMTSVSITVPAVTLLCPGSRPRIPTLSWVSFLQTRCLELLCYRAVRLSPKWKTGVTWTPSGMTRSTRSYIPYTPSQSEYQTQSDARSINRHLYCTLCKWL